MEALIPADPVKLARSWLLSSYPWPVTVVKNRPNPTTGRVVTVRWNGGMRDDMVTDAPWLSVECFADTDADAADLARHTWGRLFAMKGEVIDGIQCYRVDPLGAPNDFPSVEPGTGVSTPRFVMSVQALFRSHAAA